MYLHTFPECLNNGACFFSAKNQFYSWKRSRPGWTGFGGTWCRGRCPCPLQGSCNKIGVKANSKPNHSLISVWLRRALWPDVGEFCWAPHGAEAFQSHSRLRCAGAKVLAQDSEPKGRKIPKRPGRKETAETLGGKVSESSSRGRSENVS